MAIFVVKYLREYESIFEAALAHESVDPGSLFDEKKPRGENLLRLRFCLCTGNNLIIALLAVRENTIPAILFRRKNSRC
jgi:hypothetical protein